MFDSRSTISLTSIATSHTSASFIQFSVRTLWYVIWFTLWHTKRVTFSYFVWKEENVSKSAFVYDFNESVMNTRICCTTPLTPGYSLQNDEMFFSRKKRTVVFKESKRGVTPDRSRLTAALDRRRQLTGRSKQACAVVTGRMRATRACACVQCACTWCGRCAKGNARMFILLIRQWALALQSRDQSDEGLVGLRLTSLNTNTLGCASENRGWWVEKHKL